MPPRSAFLAVGAVGAGGVIAALLLLTGTIGDDGNGDGDTTDPGERNEFVPERSNTIIADGLAFDPTTLTVRVGDAIAFENHDDVAHTFTADDGLFDSRQVDPDGRYGYTVPRAGEVGFHCEIHPQMTGTITVEE